MPHLHGTVVRLTACLNYGVSTAVVRMLHSLAADSLCALISGPPREKTGPARLPEEVLLCCNQDAFRYRHASAGAGAAVQVGDDWLTVLWKKVEYLETMGLQPYYAQYRQGAGPPPTVRSPPPPPWLPCDTEMTRCTGFLNRCLVLLQSWTVFSPVSHHPLLSFHTGQLHFCRTNASRGHLAVPTDSHDRPALLHFELWKL